MVVGNLNESEYCDVVVIGGGPGGYVCAIRLAQLGKDVILVDKRATLGGVCLNEGCIPSKAFIHAAETIETIKHSNKMGIICDQPALDMKTLQKWKKGIVRRLTGGVAQLEKASGVRVFQGTAKFEGTHKLEVTDAEGKVLNVEFQHAVIATGTEAINLPNMPFDGDFVIGSKGALDLDELPEKMVVIGGGYIGLELGTAFQKLGSQVTVVELQSELLSGNLEPEIQKLVTKRAKAIGLKVLTEHRAISVTSGTPGSVKVAGPDGKEQDLETNKVLVVVGRRPFTEGLGLKNAQLQTNAQGFIDVDESRRTSQAHIFAIGDITGGPMLAHKAYFEAKVAAEVIVGNPAGYDVRVVPAVMFVDPEIASVGMTEAEAIAAGHKVQVGVFPLKASGRALTLGGPEGLAKVVAEAGTQRLLGFHIAGPHAAELIGEGTLALELDAFLDDIAHTIHPHPTLNEAVLEAAELALGTCAHFVSPKK